MSGRRKMRLSYLGRAISRLETEIAGKRREIERLRLLAEPNPQLALPQILGTRHRYRGSALDVEYTISRV